ncbi:MAG: hypothetical protein AAGM38_03265 [Pseudomonadota bacterium]
MIRILHLALVILFVGLALLGYGAREETRALQMELAELEKRKRAVETEIALLQAEWDHVSSAAYLKQTVARLRATDPRIGEEILGLAPWRPEQAQALRRRDARPPLAATGFGMRYERLMRGDGSAIATASVARPARDEGAAGAPAESPPPFAAPPRLASPRAEAPERLDRPTETALREPSAALPEISAPSFGPAARPEAPQPLGPTALRDAALAGDQERWREIFMAQPGAPREARRGGLPAREAAR